jgi:hypothetical protein
MKGGDSMGLICSCGVLVDGSADNVNVIFENMVGNECGTLTYSANVCADTLNLSTVGLTFVDNGGCPNKSFTFTSTMITNVTCMQEGQNCVISVAGVGLVNGVEYLFKAVFRDQVSPSNVSIVTSFVITNFFTQGGAVTLEQGDITAQGCGD